MIYPNDSYIDRGTATDFLKIENYQKMYFK